MFYYLLIKLYFSEYSSQEPTKIGTKIPHSRVVVKMENWVTEPTLLILESWKFQFSFFFSRMLNVYVYVYC